LFVNPEDGTPASWTSLDICGNALEHPHERHANCSQLLFEHHVRRAVDLCRKTAPISAISAKSFSAERIWHVRPVAAASGRKPLVNTLQPESHVRDGDIFGNAELARRA
jgi:hypothetical protein